MPNRAAATSHLPDKNFILVFQKTSIYPTLILYPVFVCRQLNYRQFNELKDTDFSASHALVLGNAGCLAILAVRLGGASVQDDVSSSANVQCIREKEKGDAQSPFVQDGSPGIDRFARLLVHPQATGFQRGVSFVENARCHQSQAIVIRLDLVDFFPSIHRVQIEKFFRRIGWNRKAARLLADLTTLNGALPQGAPTSPRLSNLVNYRLDASLAGLAKSHEGIYTRYADDITISLGSENSDVHAVIAELLRIVRAFGYTPHLGRKFDVRRRHQRQVVTGLVVNDRASLSREKKRWLRAVEYRTRIYKQGGTFCPPPTLTEQQLRGWRSLTSMINRLSE